MPVAADSGSPFDAGGGVKAFNDHSIPPGQGGDVVHNVFSDLLGHHAENTHVQH